MCVCIIYIYIYLFIISLFIYLSIYGLLGLRFLELRVARVVRFRVRAAFSLSGSESHEDCKASTPKTRLCARVEGIWPP